MAEASKEAEAGSGVVRSWAAKEVEPAQRKRHENAEQPQSLSEYAPAREISEHVPSDVHCAGTRAANHAALEILESSKQAALAQIRKSSEIVGTHVHKR